MDNQPKRLTHNGSVRKRWVSHPSWRIAVPDEIPIDLVHFVKPGDIKIKYGKYKSALTTLAEETVLVESESPSTFDDRYLHKVLPVEIIQRDIGRYSSYQGMASLEFVSSDRGNIEALAERVGFPRQA